MEPAGFWYATAACPECDAGRLAFAVRRDGRTPYLLCVECGANYAEPPRPGDENPAFDPPPADLGHSPRWATRAEVEARGWGGSAAGFEPTGA